MAAVKAYVSKELFLYRLTSSKSKWPNVDEAGQLRMELQISTALSIEHKAVVCVIFSESGSIILDVLSNVKLWAGATSVVICAVEYSVIQLPYSDVLKPVLLWNLGYVAEWLDPHVAAATKDAVQAVLKGFKAWKETQTTKPSVEGTREKYVKARPKEKHSGNGKRSRSSAGARASTKKQRAKKAKRPGNDDIVSVAPTEMRAAAAQ